MHLPIASTAATSISRRQALAWLGLGGLATTAGVGLRAQTTGTAAPVAAPAVPKIYPYKVGEVELWAISDAFMALPHSVFAGGVAEAEVSALTAEALLPAQYPGNFTPTLIKAGSELILVDVGNPAGEGQSVNQLARLLEAAGIARTAITGVLITHAHGDHIGGIRDASGALTYPNATYFITAAEHEFWTTASDLPGSLLPVERRKGMIEGARGYLGAVPAAKWQKVAGGDKLAPWVEIVSTPGHTPGHCSVLVASGNEQVMLLADAVHHYVFGFQRPEWKVAFDVDAAVGATFRRQILGRMAAEKMRCHGFHLPFPGLGRVRAVGEAFEWVIEPMQLS